MIERRRVLRAMGGTTLGVAAMLAMPHVSLHGAAAPPPEYVIQGVPTIAQVWSLSCEYAATSAATGLYGLTLSQQTMHAEIGNHLNPHRGFRGNIRGSWGGTDDYGVYPEAIVPALHRHGYTRSRAFRAGTDTLKRELAAGNPVVVWIVGDYTAQHRVYLMDGAESYFVIPYEHAVTLYGYDERGVHIMDPGRGVKYHESWDRLEFGWAQLDHMALTVAK